MTLFLIGLGIGLGGGAGITAAILKPRAAKQQVETVTATGEAVEGGITAGGEAAATVLTAAQQVELERARAQTAIANTPALTIAVQAVVDEHCAPATLALASQLAANAASQGKEGSASVNAEEAQVEVGKTLEAMRNGLCAPPDLVVCTGDECPSEVNLGSS